jgi:tetratricopeptide (TPR) repeat protein
MMMYRNLFLGVLVSICLFSVSLEAKVYSPKDPAVLEIQQHVKLYRERPNAENRFELAMAYGWYGFIEKGWAALKKVPKSYAPTVLDVYGPLVKQHPGEARYPFKLAFGYYFLGEKEKAKASFRAVLALDPKQVWAMGFLALIEGEEGHNQVAIDWCKRALAIDPNATAIHFLLAEAYRRTGNYFGMMGEAMAVGRLKTQEKMSGVRFEDGM